MGTLISKAKCLSVTNVPMPSKTDYFVKALTRGFFFICICQILGMITWKWQNKC